jgi:cell division GTPase FtsZ
MIDCGVQGVEFVAANTDDQALKNHKASFKMHLGTHY